MTNKGRARHTSKFRVARQTGILLRNKRPSFWTRDMNEPPTTGHRQNSQIARYRKASRSAHKVPCLAHKKYVLFKIKIDRKVNRERKQEYSFTYVPRTRQPEHNKKNFVLLLSMLIEYTHTLSSREKGSALQKRNAFPNYHAQKETPASQDDFRLQYNKVESVK